MLGDARMASSAGRARGFFGMQNVAKGNFEPVIPPGRCGAARQSNRSLRA